MVADVAHVGGSQQRVAEDVANNVGVGMAYRAKVAGDLNTSQPERTPGFEPMYVVSLTYSYFHSINGLRRIPSVRATSPQQAVLHKVFAIYGFFGYFTDCL